VLDQTELKEGEDYGLIPKELEENLASIETLNKIYNASDIYVTTTLGEGWGLTITEAMATRLPVIAPNSTSIAEIIGNDERGYLLNTMIPFCAQNDSIIREQTDYWEVAETIIQVATDLQKQDVKLKSRVDNAFNWVNSLSWKEVSKRWIDYFRDIYWFLFLGQNKYPRLFLLVGFFVNLVIDNLKSIKMSDLLETIERTEDGGFIVQLKNEDGDVLAEGQGDTYESALEDANSKL